MTSPSMTDPVDVDPTQTSWWPAKRAEHRSLR
jgi:hypothetical protein